MVVMLAMAALKSVSVWSMAMSLMFLFHQIASKITFYSVFVNSLSTSGMSKMENQNVATTAPAPAVPAAPALTSCRKKKKDEATFLEDVKDHIDEFINASMDEHKSCFTKTVQKMFGMSRVVAERNATTQEVESSLPLKTVVSD
ncbi:hypothetical protein BT93_B1275 [Corymbia citriodora subsp. variegata]|nr:hypothetical protein BT93_B1275 [Corymbia citriodora subsp. variegata]